MYLDAALADDWDDEEQLPAPVEATPPVHRARARLRRPALLAGVTTLLAVAFMTFAYQPLGPGTVSAADQRLLLPGGVSPSATRVQTAEFRYRFQASTSYETLVYVRNDGPLPVTLAGIDQQASAGASPIARPVELRLLPLGSRAQLQTWEQAKPWRASVIDSGKQLALWVRWETSACPANRVLLGAGASASVRTVPLQWSVAGIPRRSALDLGYTVRFEVTPQTFSGQCDSVPGLPHFTPTP